MNLLDIGILVCTAIAAWAGWRMGFLARIFSWVGLAAGLYLAVVFMPNVLDLGPVVRPCPTGKFDGP